MDDLLDDFKSDLKVKEDENGRRYAEYVVTDGRDKDKKFLISEMNVTDSFRFLMRAGNALADTGLMPEYISRAATIEWQTLFGITFSALSAIRVETLVELVLDLYSKSIRIWGGGDWREVIPDIDLLENSSFMNLADKVVELHAGFSLAAVVSGFWTMTQGEAIKVMQEKAAALNSEELPTSTPV